MKLQMLQKILSFKPMNVMLDIHGNGAQSRWQMRV